jgi:peroxiredoxin
MDDDGGKIALLFCAAFVVLSCIMMLDRCAARRPRGPAPDIGIHALLQAPVRNLRSLRDLRGQALVLEFWATWCGSCTDALPHMNRLRAAFKDRPAVFISVTNEPRETVERFLLEHPTTGWIGLDPDDALHKAFGVRGIPQVFVIDSRGEIVVKVGPSFLYASDIEKAISPPKD